MSSNTTSVFFVDNAVNAESRQPTCDTSNGAAGLKYARRNTSTSSERFAISKTRMGSFTVTPHSSEQRPRGVLDEANQRSPLRSMLPLPIPGGNNSFFPANGLAGNILARRTFRFCNENASKPSSTMAPVFPQDHRTGRFRCEKGVVFVLQQLVRQDRCMIGPSGRNRQCGTRTHYLVLEQFESLQPKCEISSRRMMTILPVPFLNDPFTLNSDADSPERIECCYVFEVDDLLRQMRPM